MLRSIVAFAVILSLLPVVLSGPACAKKHWQAADCVQRCKTKWGFPGRMMGTNSWGVVMQKDVKQSSEVWGQAVAAACGTNAAKATSSGGPVKADGALPIVPPSSSVSSVILSVSTSAAQTTSSIASTSSSSAATTTTAVAAANKAIVKGGLGGAAPTTTSSRTTVASTTSAPPPPSSSPPPPPKETPPPPPHTTQPPQPKPSPQPKPAPAPPSGGNSGGSSSGGDIDVYLSAHNSFRSQHGAAPLTWSDNLASKAQQWANNCVFEHSKGALGPFGENLAAGTGSAYDIQSAIKSWTDEVKDYNPNNPVPSHFTQVVWKGSSQVGCAEALCDGIFDAKFGKAKYFVCEYSAQGNIIGQFAQNVQA